MARIEKRVTIAVLAAEVSACMEDPNPMLEWLLRPQETRMAYVEGER